MATFTLPLGAFLTRYAPAGEPDTWPAVMDEMAASAGDWSRVLILAGALLGNGRFRDPVRVSEAENGEGGECGYPASVSDGMHRAAAHILAAADTIELTYGSPEAGPTALAVSFYAEPGPGSPLDDVFDAVADHLSFPLSHDVWAQSDMLASRHRTGHTGAVYETWWDVPPELDETLVAMFTARLADAGLNVREVTASRECALCGEQIPSCECGGAAAGEWVEYDDLPSAAQSSLRHQDHTPAGAGPGPGVRDALWQLESVPAAEMKRRVMSADPDLAAHGGTFEAYHQWYLDAGPVTDHGASRWPVIEHDPGAVSEGYLDDGWHRLHSYIRAGDDHIPLLRRQDKKAAG